MDNVEFGLITISICVIGYSLSFKYWVKDKYTIALLTLVFCGLALRIFVSSDFFLHDWDEKYHALVAKNFIQHPFVPTLYDKPVLPYDYRNWTANHIWVHKQPLPLWIMASSMWLFGINEIGLRLPSILISTIGIYLLFMIGSNFFNRKTGFLAAYLFSINGLIIELTGGRVATDHIDIYFLFFIELAITFSILFVQKGKTIFNVLAGIALGAAILSKWLPALIVLPIWLLIVIDSGIFKPKIIIIQLIILLLACTIIFLPWQIYIYRVFPVEARWEAGFNMKHITQALEGQTGPIYYFINKIRINYGELVYLPLLWFIWKTIKNPNNLMRLAISIWFVIPFLFFSFAKTKMQAYILFTSPALFIMIAEFWIVLEEYRRNHRFKWLINIILVLLLALPIRYSIERIKPFDKTDKNPQWVRDLRKLNELNISKGILFNYSNPVEAMFYSNLTVYQNIPEMKVLLDLQQKGYTVILNNKGEIPEQIKNLKGLIIIELSDPL